MTEWTRFQQKSKELNNKRETQGQHKKWLNELSRVFNSLYLLKRKIKVSRFANSTFDLSRWIIATINILTMKSLSEMMSEFKTARNDEIWRNRSVWSKVNFRLKFMLIQDWQKFLTKVLTKKIRAALSRI